MDIIRRSFSCLIEPSPDWSSKYPYGHLLLVKLATEIFGYSEYALRTVPLFFGIAAVLLFFKVAKNNLDRPSLLIALGLFSVSELLILEASNLKPYSGDMAIALLIIAWADFIKERRMNFAHAVLAAVAGAVMLWLSHTSLFVLAGVGICLAVPAIRKRDRQRISWFAIVFLVWAMSFLTCYFIYIRNLLSNLDMSIDELLVIERSFVTLPPTSLKDVQHLTDMFFDLFTNPLGPLGFTFAGLSAFAFIVGCVFIYRRDKGRFYMLMAPVLVTLLASIMHKYPFKGRFLVFMAPIIIIFMAEGAERVREKTSGISIVIGAVLIGLLFFHPATMAAYRIKRPFYYEDVKPVLKYIESNWKEGDIIYVYYYSQYVFDYYTRIHPEHFLFNEKDYVTGIAPRGWYRTWRKNQVSKYYGPKDQVKQTSAEIYKKYADDMDKLKGRKRMWVLFTGLVMKDNMLEEKYFVYHLESIGRKLDSFGIPGVSAAYLYDLSDAEQTGGEQ